MHRSSWLILLAGCDLSSGVDDTADTADTGGAADDPWDRAGVLLGAEARGGAGGPGTLSALDPDGDGAADLAMGSPDANEGALWIVADPGAITTRALVTDVATASVRGRWVGWLAQGAGDADGDGVNDLAVGRGKSLDPAFAGEGAVYLMEGDTLPSASSLLDARGEFEGQSTGDMVRFGALGDLDGDGLADLTVGARSDNDSMWEWSASGSAAVYLAGGPPGTRSSADADAVMYGTWFEQALGAAVASADLDGDGYGDLLLGAPEWETDIGVVAIVPGNPSATWDHQVSSAASTLVYGGAGASSLGEAPFCAPGDLDGDGDPDLALSSPASGAVWLWSGVPSGVTSTDRADVTVRGDAESFGAALACDADRDGDGADELVVGDPLSVGVGAVHLFALPLGGAADLSPADATGTSLGEAAGDGFGSALATLGDLLVVGAPGVDEGVEDGGAAYLLQPR